MAANIQYKRCEKWWVFLATDKQLFGSNIDFKISMFCKILLFVVWIIYRCFQELDVIEPDGNVYKLIGPVLVKQDLEEAKQTVKKRIEYISAEL